MPLHVEGGTKIQVLGPVGPSNMMGSSRRTRELSDIAPQYVAKSGLCNASELESSRGGSIRIQHVTGLSGAGEGKSRFPKLDECAHFHYEHVDIGPLQVSIVDDDDLKPLSNETEDGKWWSLSVTSQNKTWLIRRSYENFRMLDQQLHRCIYDRKFSELMELPAERIEEQENIHKLLSDYVSRFSVIAGSLINCGPVLNWLELDNRGHRLLVPDTDNCPINTPAVAAAYSVKRYTAQAPDEISFEVGDMISVIDMPPPEESIWWRGKRGFQVGFFPCECVAVIGDKVPRNLQFSPQIAQPTKPVLRKHGKLIAFFRSFILSRPSRRKLKQSGILKERVFGCDLGEHLLNSGHEIPMVLKCCVEFIESHGLVDGIYRLSGVTSNIQKLRNAFDEDRVPALYEDEAILQDVHSVASLLKMYFRELPNPLCTYQLYHQFVGAVQVTQGDDTRLLRMRDVVQKLPPPHYRTLEYLMRHLSRVSEKGHETGMTSRNVAIVWAPNLLRCKELEVGGVAALQGVGVQAVVTEFLVCYADLIFCDGLPNISLPPQQVNSKKSRPKSLAISTPTKLLSLEEARTRALLQSSGNVEPDYIEVGGGPASLPAKYHTVIELPSHSRKRLGSKRSPIGWKLLFGKSGRGSQSRKEAERKASTPSDIGLGVEKAVTELDLTQTRRRLRPAKSVESLSSNRNSGNLEFSDSFERGLGSPKDTLSPMMLRNLDGKNNGHNRSVSHESYFDQLQDQKEDPGLDISEIQVNFDLEESEMRIFSEDETLVSAGSGSLMSNSSPRILPTQKASKSLISSFNKRLSYPKVSQGEDRLNGTQSADPSPKKQKTNDGILPRSKLEEQLSSSVGDIQFIDSVSPDQVLVQAEVHLIQSPSPVSSLSQISSSLLAPSSPILPHIPHLQRPMSQVLVSEDSIGSNTCLENNHFGHGNSNKSNNSINMFRTTRPLSTASSEINSYLTSPSLAEATVSDNESFSLQSSELTTPDTPMCRSYAPLIDLEESSASNMTTPDFDEKTRKYSSETDYLDKAMIKVNSEFDNCKNIGKEFAKFDERFSSDTPVESKPRYENIKSDMVKPEGLKTEITAPIPEERKTKPIHPYANIPIVKPQTEPRKVLETSFDIKEIPDKVSNRNSVISIKYECISTESSCDSLINENKSSDSFLLQESKPVTPVIESIENDILIDVSKKSSIKEPTETFEESEKPLTKEPTETFKESEMNLLSECSNWLENQIEFSKKEYESDLKENVSFSCDGWLKDRNVNNENGGLKDDQTEISNKGNNFLNTDICANNEIISVEDKNTQIDIGNESSNPTPDDASLSSILINVFGENTKKSFVENNSKNGTDVTENILMAEPLVTDFPVIEEPIKTERKILETNLDDLEFHLNEEILTTPSKSCKLEKKPIPKKRTLPQKSNSSGNVRQLLSKFEMSPTSVKDLMDLRSEFESRRKNQGESENDSIQDKAVVEERPKTLERMSTNRRSERKESELPIVQLEKSKSGSNIGEQTCGGAGIGPFNRDFDLSDPQRRERIEKYKEKRRNYLREKYRSDSFKNEKDDFLVKIKQRHIQKGEGEDAKVREVPEKSRRHATSLPFGEKSPTSEKPARRSLPKSIESPSRDTSRRSFSVEVSGRLRYEYPTLSSSLRDNSTRRTNFLRFSNERKSANDLRSSKGSGVSVSPESSPEKKNHSLEFFVSETNLDDKLSPSPHSYYLRRRMTDPTRPSARKSSDVSPTRKSRSAVNKSDKLPDEGSSSPSSIKDMAAFFEKREDSKSHKQFLSSV